MNTRRRASSRRTEPAKDITHALETRVNGPSAEIEAARRGGVELLVIPALAAMFDAALAGGDGGLDAASAARMPIRGRERLPRALLALPPRSNQE
jgi:hypothetical protein